MQSFSIVFVVDIVLKDPMRVSQDFNVINIPLKKQ